MTSLLLMALLACSGKDEPPGYVPVDPFADYVVDDTKFSAPLGEVATDGELSYAADQLLVVLDPADADVQPVVDSLGATLVGQLPQLGIYQLQVDPTQLSQLRADAEDLPEVATAALNLVVEEWYTPSPDYCHQPDDIHDNLVGDLRCAHADFDYFSGVPIYDEVFASIPHHPVRVAVVDSGCQGDVGEFDDLHLIDLEDPAGGLVDDVGHGTCVTSIIAADNDGLGINGAASRVLGSKLELGVTGHQGTTMGGLIALHRASLDFEARVVNASWGMRTNATSAPRQAEMYRRVFAVAPDTMFVFAAGNDGVEVTETNWMPQGLTVDNVIKVGGTAHCDGDTRWTHSNFGPLVDFSAPAQKVPAVRYFPSRGIDDPLGEPLTLNGTSASAPLVTSSLAVLFSIDPTVDVETVRRLMERSTRGGPLDLGYGRISLVTTPLQHALDKGVPPNIEQLLDRDVEPGHLDPPGLIVNRLCGGFDLSIDGVGAWHVGGPDEEVSGVFLYNQRTDMLLQSEEDFFSFTMTLDGPFVLGSPYVFPLTLDGAFGWPNEYWSGSMKEGTVRLTNCAVTERMPFTEGPLTLEIEGTGGGTLELLHAPNLYPTLHAFETQFSLPAFAMTGLDPAVFEERCIDGRALSPDVLSIDDVMPGELVISEVLFGSNLGATQWIEIVNVGTKPIDLDGLVVQTSEGGAHPIDRSVVLQPSQRAVLGNREAEDWDNPTAQPDAWWGSGLVLDLYGEAVAIGGPAGLLDVTAPFDDATVGVSWQVDPRLESEAANDDVRAWCRWPAVADVDLGTPAQPNTLCELVPE